VPELGEFTDERGTIKDLLLGPIDGVTEIFTKAGAVRGNHVHTETVQWSYVVYGILKVATYEDGEVKLAVHQARSLIEERAGIPHAWKAMTDCLVLVVTRGPRTAEDYEKDTTRLTIPLLA
jgi:quercetin dioxygenase-like cupin family protein